MTLQQAKDLSLNSGGLFDEPRYPVLPWHYNYINRYRVYVTMFDVDNELWHDLNLDPKAPYSDVQTRFDETSKIELNRLSSLVEAAKRSILWRALSLEELFKLNTREWKDIPHERG